MSLRLRQSAVQYEAQTGEKRRRHLELATKVREYSAITEKAHTD